MVPIKVVHPEELLTHTMSGVGITPEGEQFAVFNLVGESGVMVQFDKDPRFRYKVLMKDCIQAIKEFHEEYRNELLNLAHPDGGEEAAGGAPQAPGPVAPVQHDRSEGRPPGD